MKSTFETLKRFFDGGGAGGPELPPLIVETQQHLPSLDLMKAMADLGHAISRHLPLDAAFRSLYETGFAHGMLYLMHLQETQKPETQKTDDPQPPAEPWIACGKKGEA